MMAAEGAIKPVADVLHEGGVTFDKSQYLPGIVAYYSKPDGTMLSFPYNSSSPILYYNKDIFAEGRARRRQPAEDLERGLGRARRRSRRSGAAPCGYTSAWLTWIHLENFAAWNDVPYGTNENGLAGTDVELKINAPIFVNHFQAHRRPRQGRHLQVRRPHLGGEADLPRRRMRHLHRELRRPRRHRQVRA